MSSPAAAPTGSPPESTSPESSPPPASSTPPTSSSTPPASPAPSNQTPPAPPPTSPVSSPSPPAPPTSPVSSPSPPAPPPESTTPSPPPPVQETSPPPPPVRATPTPVQETSPPAESPPPPVSSEQLSPPPTQSSSPPEASPPSSTPSPPATQSFPPPSASSLVSPPPPSTSSALSPPPPPASTSTPTTPSTSTPTSPSPPPSGTVSTGTVAVIVVAAVVAVSVLLVLLVCFCKKKKKRPHYSGDHHGPPGGFPAHYKDSYYDPNAKQQGWHSPYSSQSSDVLLNMPPPPPPITEHDPTSPKGNSGASQGMGNSKSWFTYADLAKATNGFSKANMLGEGGFGCVYKGVLSNGQVVAVKQLKSGASQGEKEFQAEVEIISRVHHRHLVSLVGYCIADNQRLLIYDYMPNDTLEYHLHKRKGLDWPTRIKIASGSARGLAYLHEDCHPRIIHRDIKSANILLDNNFEAQVSDFGLAKLTSDANTHVTTRVMGTFGYLAPEYASSGKLTDKSDVYSFGVVLLELLTGRKPVDVSQPPGQESLVEWARPVLAQVESEEDLEMFADPALNGVYDSKEMLRMAEAAAACIRHSAHKRPRMGQVVRALEDEISIADLNKGLKPGHSSVYGSSFSSGEYENGSYSADIRRFRMALNENSDTGISPNPYSSSEYQTSLEIDQDTRRPARMSGHNNF